MKIAVLAPDYPSPSSHAFAFVHARAKLYRDFGHGVEVFVKNPSEGRYEFEGIRVNQMSRFQFKQGIRQWDPDVLAIHYPTYSVIPLIDQLKYPKVAWLHGHEILWSFRLMAARGALDWAKKRMVVLPRVAFQILAIRTFLTKVNHCVFVSNWLLKAAERHTCRTFSNKVVIPNPVDTRLFSYQVPKNITKGISVRSLERTQYGVDVALKGFANLNIADLTVFGKGRFQARFTEKIRKLGSNALIVPEAVRHNSLPDLYHKYGFFVAPSRFETQGVAMCEAMACGLPVVATNVGGIPEFVRDGVDGYLVPPNDPKALRKAVERLVTDQKKFFAMSANAREHIKEVCDSEIIVKREVQILEKALRDSD